MKANELNAIELYGNEALRKLNWVQQIAENQCDKDEQVALSIACGILTQWLDDIEQKYGDKQD